MATRIAASSTAVLSPPLTPSADDAGRLDRGDLAAGQRSSAPLQLGRKRFDLLVGGADGETHLLAARPVLVLALQALLQPGQAVVDRLLKRLLDDGDLALLLGGHLGQILGRVELAGGARG